MKLTFSQKEKYILQYIQSRDVSKDEQVTTDVIVLHR